MTLKSLRKCVAIPIASGLALMYSHVYAAGVPQQIQRHIPQVIDYLNENGFRNVGVLRFRVKKPGQQTSSSVGSLNSLLADRLEIGLILANPFQEHRQLNILKEASAQAAAIDGATHLTAEGRAVFF